MRFCIFYVEALRLIYFLFNLSFKFVGNAISVLFIYIRDLTSIMCKDFMLGVLSAKMKQCMSLRLKVHLSKYAP